MYHKTAGYRIFSAINLLFLVVVSLSCILPLVHILAVSLSSSWAASGGLVRFWPVGFTTAAFEKTLNNPNFLHAIWVSVLRTVLGTVLTMTLITMAAYALSKEDRAFKGRTAYVWFFVFTMLFNAGIIPTYIVINKLGLLNQIWALVLPGAVSVFSLVLMLNFFRGIPKELEEAALMDGAGHFRTLFSMYLPLSLPSIATLTLFSIVGHWNAWFDALMYMTDYRNYPLATFLQSIVVNLDATRLGITPEDLKSISDRTLKASQVFIASLPIIALYPFLQKYFVHGLTLGSVKE
ncbi:carbohydrate ABC transporter permease [Paenibacillus gansuensis]|uniref:Carbohydrate ABC transporter permease n=1 Tax=Paenibacillus gansuensis TaxID=306542 RepID=A0ABW5P9N9_9BACL